MNLYQLLWCFVVYGFFGWCVEVAYSAIKKKVFINRGFLNGPFCPIYGFSVICVTEMLAEYKSNLLLLYGLSIVLVTAIEWIVGFLLEKIFHHKWWDYSEEPLNIKGYICIPFSMAWGVGCVMIVRVIQPMLLNLIDFIPHNLGNAILFVTFTMLVIDLGCTINEILQLNFNLRKMEKISEEILRLTNSLGESISQNVFNKMEKQENIKLRIEEKKMQRREIFEKITSENRRIFNAFPNMNTIKDKIELHEKGRWK